MDIAVIGTGQIGTRHLEALTRFDGEAVIHAVDASEPALQHARDHLSRLARHAPVRLVFHSSPERLPEEVAVAIIATSARHRLAALESLLAQTQPRRIIFEKVLFQRLQDYARARRLLTERCIDAWVNCPRRMMPFFEDLLPLFSDGSPLRYSIDGTNWGLACNAIHFIDNVAMYAGTSDYELDTSRLDPLIHPSKRSGFIELSGSLCGSFAQDRAEFELRCEILEGAPPALSTVIENEGYRVAFDSQGATATLLHKGSGEARSIPYKLVYQSELTQKAVAALIENGNCQLTDFEESVRLHIPLMTRLKGFVEDCTGAPSEALDIT